jgi:hypothetical protein
MFLKLLSFCLLPGLLSPASLMAGQPPPVSPFYTLDAPSAQSVLFIEIKTAQVTRYASAIVVDAPKGLAITSWHSLIDLQRIRALPAGDTPDGTFAGMLQLLLNNQAIDAKLIYAEPWHDLALIQLKKLPATAQTISLTKTRPAPESKLHLDGQPAERNLAWQRLDAIAQQCRCVRWVLPQQTIATQVIEADVPEDPGMGFSGALARTAKGELAGMVIAGAKKKVYLVEAAVIERFLRRGRFVPQLLGIQP